ncbi:hypothetical protein ASPWEDRAFT_627621 [Aspergillus wentii DTO 134E9]|uniref:SMP-30/Gluconolactonase/LRE-like region domain-containing protein n=1 Tax=Aspergillus wentii DTO 134E9 TaxID=1073089 RepID=A0A1L9R9U2_ASPWE|nr:uncharacterized protein ASPWEDRAFT_672214 [Aspergillus wentii DTO 134E9]XP_040685372.1 uncharacterized protein ASPWEDRAFT_627621 [Aspergillus wentii DTO 134E9]OJJ30786.1 hypothetical protein ASPWEDRAFT_672214 [Aspergillus wentii DTO 134E9]OJJ31695.1 hypothetical protein ASPWEDRAFT_627621 [Aspergillus wentii DTO 134E9]
MHLPTLASLAILASSALAQSTTQLFNFTTYVDIENSILRPNGHLLLTTFNNGSLYTLDPTVAKPKAELVAVFPGVTAISGIAAIGANTFAVVGGIRGHYHYTNETVFTVDFDNEKDETKPTIKAVTQVPEAVMFNGLASLPTRPDVVFVADSRRGCLFQVDTKTGNSKIAFQHPALFAPANASIPIGINGLKIANGNVFFTNSARNIFARIPISENGDIVNDVKVIARLNSNDGSDWDDFAIDASGVAYVAQPHNALARITPDGKQVIVAGGGNSTALHGPTSVNIAKDGKTAYVTTQGGQVVRVELPGYQ